MVSVAVGALAARDGDLTTGGLNGQSGKSPRSPSINNQQVAASSGIGTTRQDVEW